LVCELLLFAVNTCDANASLAVIADDVSVGERKFLIYDVNYGEGFNLRRDVFMRDLQNCEYSAIITGEWSQLCVGVTALGRSASLEEKSLESAVVTFLSRAQHQRIRPCH
uniref:CPSF_A domain-containing protein n=1 Tax=Gongylonema pulchrum TaxID=637853 RepID=A0A183ETI9_9BILA